MEQADRHTEMVGWVNASSRHTTGELASLPGYPALLADVGAATRAPTYAGHVGPAGDAVFFRRIAPDRQVPVLMVRHAGPIAA